jgi:hypothetical protein
MSSLSSKGSRFSGELSMVVVLRALEIPPAVLSRLPGRVISLSGSDVKSLQGVDDNCDGSFLVAAGV